MLPVFILVVIAIPSFKLLMNQYTYPEAGSHHQRRPGNAWFWEHQYPDQGNFTITSNMLSDERSRRAQSEGHPGAAPVCRSTTRSSCRVNKVVHVLVTSNDVIHNWTDPVVRLEDRRGSRT